MLKSKTGRLTNLLQIFWSGGILCPGVNVYDFLLLSPHAAFIKERKMGLNDFIQKLVSTPHICQQ